MLIFDRMQIIKGLSTSASLISNLNLGYFGEEDRIQPTMTTWTAADGIVLALEFPATNNLYTNYALPRQHLIENYGANLIGLSLGFNRHLYDYQLHKDHLNGHVFNYIFKHCPKIKILTLVDATLQHCDLDDTTVHDCIEELELINCNIEEGAILTELSASLPKLKYLNACKSNFHPENDIYGEEHMKFLMPRTSFEALAWSGWSEDIFRSNYYLKLTLVNGCTSYYRGLRYHHYMEQVFPDKDNWRAFTEEGAREDELLIEVECKSVKTFILNLEHVKVIIKNPGQEIMKEGVVELIQEFTEKGTDFLLNLQ